MILPCGNIFVDVGTECNVFELQLQFFLVLNAYFTKILFEHINIHVS